MKTLSVISSAGLLALGLWSGSAQAQSSGTLSFSAEVEAVFDLARELYPDWFTDPLPLGLYEGYTYRHFPSSGIYVGVKDDEIYVMGGPFGPDITKQGTTAGVHAFLEEEKLRIEIDHDNEDAAGDYDVTISGTSTPVGIPFTVQIPEITLKGVKAPSKDDEDAIRDMIMNDIPEIKEVRNLKVVVENDTEQRKTLKLAFDATVESQGVTSQASYDLTYDYVKN